MADKNGFELKFKIEENVIDFHEIFFLNKVKDVRQK